MNNSILSALFITAQLVMSRESQVLLCPWWREGLALARLYRPPSHDARVHLRPRLRTASDPLAMRESGRRWRIAPVPEDLPPGLFRRAHRQACEQPEACQRTLCRLIPQVRRVKRRVSFEPPPPQGPQGKRP